MKKLAVVTGAASGIGLEFSKLLAQDSYDLILNDINSDELSSVAKKLQEVYNISVSTIKCDLGKKDAGRKFCRILGSVTPDVFINNAGFGIRGKFINIPWEIEESMINLHIITPTYLTKQMLKGMSVRGHGKILNIASIGALSPGPLMAIYYATKGYLMSFGAAIANEIKKSGVTVTTICPGQTNTNFANGVAKLSHTSIIEKGFFREDCKYIARVSYKAMLKGRVLCFPGIKTKILVFLMWLLPRTLAISVIKKKHLKSMLISQPVY